MGTSRGCKACCALALVFLLLSSTRVDGRPQFWNRFRDVVLGRPSNSGSPQQSPPPAVQQSGCDKGDSYSPDNCNKCYCVGSTYRCTLKHCDESLASLPAFQFD